MSFDESLLEDKLNLAVLYYKSCDFERALKLYDELYGRIARIPSSEAKKIRKEKYNLTEVPIMGPCLHPKLGSIVDQRAATYEKLGRIDKALEDAKWMTKNEPISCKGYLRTGKLYSKMKKDEEAYKNYQLGVYIIEKAVKEHHIKVPEKLFSQLKTKYKVLNHELKLRKQERSKSGFVSASNLVRENSIGSSQSRSPSQTSSRSSSFSSAFEVMLPLKRSHSAVQSAPTKKVKTHGKSQGLDPFKYFPLDIIEVIFRDISFKGLLSCHHVSKLWYYSLTKIPSLYTQRINLKPNITLSEFTHGIKLVKRVVHKSYSQQVKSLKLRSAINGAQLHKMIEILISEPNFSIKSLDLVDKNLNFQLLLNKLSKFSWKLDNLSNLEHLRLGINSSLRYETLLFQLFKKLRTLYIVVLLPEMSSSYNHIVPTTEKYFKRLCERAKDSNTDYSSLEYLTLINHPKLLTDESQLPVSFDTYNPYPIYLRMSLPNLVELTIVSFDFMNWLPSLGEFLIRTPKLTKLTLENNFNFRLLDLFQLFKNYNPNFTLEKLLFREPKIVTTTTMNEFAVSDLPQLHELKFLDIYGSSLSNKGLVKLLKICNSRKQCLQTLVIGNSSYLHFKTDSFQMGHASLLSLGQILKTCPNLENLYLNELDLDNQTMKQFHNDIEKEISYDVCKLKYLDLSFCIRIEGIGLIDLFRAVPSNIANIRRNNGGAFRLETLVIDGVEINNATLRSLQDKAFVKTIKNDLIKKKWKQYGVNCLVP